MATKELILFVPTEYHTTEFVKSCTPEENALLVGYGENLLKQHNSLVNKKVSDVHIRKLSQTLQKKEQIIDELKTEQINQQKTAKSEAVSIRDVYLQNVEQLNSEIESIQHKYQTHMKKLKEESVNEKKEITIHYKDHHLLQTETMKSIYEKEITDLRNRSQNDTLTERTKFRQEIDQLINVISELKKERTCVIEVESKRIHGSYEIAINNQSDQVKYYQKEIAELKKAHVDTVLQENQRVADDLHRSYQVSINQQTNQINQLQEEMKQKEEGLHNLNSIMSYYQKMDNVAKGSAGEHRVQEIIKKYYKNCSIQDTSGIPHSGDLLLTLQNINLKCLIEVKNKKVITTLDVNKFIHDISECKSGINCALFVSLLTENIPNKGNFYVEIRNNMPAIYIHLFDPSSIKFAIETLSFLNLKFSQTTNTELNCQESIKIFDTDTNKLIHSEYTTLLNESNRIDNIIKNVETQLIQLKLSKKNLNNRVDMITGYYNTHIHMKPDNDTINKIQEAVSDTVKEKYTSDDLINIKKWIETENKLPKKDEIRTIINCSTTEIQKRGTRILYKYMKDCLTAQTATTKSEKVLV